MDETLTMLTDLKQQFVLRDYQSYFEASSRDIGRIETLRGWEVSLISGFLIFFFANSTISFKPFLPLYMILFLFWLLEARIRSNLIARTKDIIIKEQQLQEQDLTKFCNNIISWEFGNVTTGKWNRKSLIKYTIKSMIRPEPVLWHGVIGITILLFFYLGHCG